MLFWNGLVTYYTFFVIELRSRAVHVCGTTASPNAEWMRQVARQLVDSVQGFALGIRVNVGRRSAVKTATARQLILVVAIPPLIPAVLTPAQYQANQP